MRSAISPAVRLDDKRALRKLSDNVSCCRNCLSGCGVWRGECMCDEID